MIKGHQSQSMSTLRKYLKQNSISSNLALQVQRSAHHAISGDLTPEAVELLHVVSEPLCVEMHFEMYAPILRQVPFLDVYSDFASQAMRKVCHTGMAPVLLAAGDEVFCEGEAPTAPKMYIVVKGNMEYEDDTGEVVPVLEKMWISEANLWTNWTHHGTLTATNDVKLAALDAKTFADVAGQYSRGIAPGSNQDPTAYAKKFVAFINENRDDVNDLTKMPFHR